MQYQKYKHDQQVTLPDKSWRERAEQFTRGNVHPYSSPTLSASEIGSFVFCFVPMSAGPSRAVLRSEERWWLSAGRGLSRAWR
jgi:hypothetical protein